MSDACIDHDHCGQSRCIRLCDEVDKLRAQLATLTKERDEARAAKDGAYRERNLCVAMIARLADHLGWPVWLARHEGGEWDDDWRNIVFIHAPAGQLSWHLHDSEMPNFEWIVMRIGPAWDGHTTEEKYRRALADIEKPAPQEKKGTT